MATQNQTSTEAGKTSPAIARATRRKLRRAGKKKLVAKIHAEPEFKKSYFEAKSKRANEKKSLFRKKKSKKK